MSTAVIAPVNGSGGAERTVREAPGTAPDLITRDDLTRLRDRASRDRETSATSLDTLIERFEKAAGPSGAMRFDQFKAFAAENGVDVQAPGGAPRAEDRSEAAAEARRAAEERQKQQKHQTDISMIAVLSDMELRMLAAKGDLKATREMDRRNELRAEATAAELERKVDVYA
ncbi:MAG: hypothetical protein IT178_17080 [Acidobacteria bacterium]|nr:hypothetical protein [Acidobacteriota bacterium]